MSKPKILCLHGTHTSGEIFKSQLGQLVPRLEQEQNFELHFVDGLIETECAEGMEGMLWSPYYTWCSLSPDSTLVDFKSATEALDFVQTVIEEDGPFDGIMGFSQGATVALALLLRHAAENPLDPPYALCKFAIFFNCIGIDAAQLRWDCKLSIPSLHIIGKEDRWFAQSLWATEQCEPGTAKLITHELGHAIPRDKVMVAAILDAIKDLQHRAIVF